MAIAPDLTLLTEGHALVEGGATIKAACAATGLTYSQLWYFHTLCELDPAQYLELSDAAGIVAAMEGGCSWGMLAVRLRTSESEASRRWEAITGLSRRGWRPAGKGGRKAVGLEDRYTGENAKHGVKLLNRAAAAALAEKSAKELREICKAMGLPANGSKAAMLERLQG